MFLLIKELLSRRNFRTLQSGQFFKRRVYFPFYLFFVFDLIVSINIYKIWQVSKTGENQNHSLNASKY